MDHSDSRCGSTVGNQDQSLATTAQKVVGRSTPFELSGISVGIIDGNRGRTIDHELIGEAPAIAVEDDVEVVALDRPTTSNARHSFDPSGDCSLRLGHAETRCCENNTQAGAISFNLIQRSNTNGGKKADTDQGLYWQYSLDMGASQTTNVHYLSENDFAARTSPDVAYPSGATPSPGPF